MTLRRINRFNAMLSQLKKQAESRLTLRRFEASRVQQANGRAGFAVEFV